eukprot:gene34464-42502_t
MTKIVAGVSGTLAYGGDGGQATAATFLYLSGLALDKMGSGDLFVVDRGVSRIRKIVAATGRVSTYAGGGTVSTGSGVATNALLTNLFQAYHDPVSNNLFMRWGSAVCTISSTTSVVSKYAGSLTVSGNSGDGIAATSGLLNVPLVAGPRNDTISSGTVNGAASSARFNQPYGMWGDSNNVNLYVADYVNYCLRRINLVTNMVDTFAGTMSASGYSGDGGAATSAKCYSMRAVYTESLGNIYIGESTTGLIRKVSTSTGLISTFVGVYNSFTPADYQGPVSGLMLSATAIFQFAGDSDGTLFLADYTNSIVRSIYNSTNTLSPVFAPTPLPTTSSPSISITPTAKPTTATPTVSIRPTTLYSLPLMTKIVAGVPGTLAYGRDGGQATSALFLTITGLTLDGKGTGDFYVADRSSAHVRKIVAATGLASTYAGTGTTGSFGDDGVASSAQVNGLWQVYHDPVSNCLFIPTAVVVRIVSSTTSIISVYAGRLTILGNNGDGSPATSARLSYPAGAWCDLQGNLYFTDSYNIRKVQYSNKIISTVAGPRNGAANTGSDNGAGSSATFNNPYAIWGDSSNVNLYITDYSNFVVRRIILATSMVDTLAGTMTVSGYSGDGGPATSAKLNGMRSVYIDSVGNMYLGTGGVIRAIELDTNIISTFAGVNGVSTPAGYQGPISGLRMGSLVYQMAGDSDGTLLVGDYVNGVVRSIYNSTNSLSPVVAPSPLPTTSSPSVSFTPTIMPTTTVPTLSPTALYSLPLQINTIIGNGTLGYSGDGGAATSALIGVTAGITLDTIGNIYITCGFASYDNRIRKVTSYSGIITTIAGSSSGPYTDGGPASSSKLQTINSLAVYGDFLYISVYTYKVIRKVTFSTGKLSTAVGTNYVIANVTSVGTGDGGPATSAYMGSPVAMWLDSTGSNMYIGNADSYYAIRKVNAAGIITTIAGPSASGKSFLNNGPATSSTVSWITGLFVDTSGVYLYVAETAFVVRRLGLASGIIAYFAGTGSTGASGDGGPAASSKFNYPSGVWGNTAGVVYISDYNNQVVRAVSTAGIVTGYAGQYSVTTPIGDGGPALLGAINGPYALIGDRDGTLFVTEGNRVRVIFNSTNTLAPIQYPTVSPTTSTPSLSLTPTMKPTTATPTVSIRPTTLYSLPLMTKI